MGPTLVPGVPNLRVLVAGGKAPNPAELLGSQRMQAVVDYLKQEADVVIFDAPPLLAVADAQVTGRMVDGTLLVVNTQKTSGTDLQRAIEMLEQVNVPIWGVVLNRLSRSGRGYYYYSYDYYYADSDSDDPGESGIAPKPGSPLRPSTAAGSFRSRIGITTVYFLDAYNELSALRLYRQPYSIPPV